MYPDMTPHRPLRPLNFLLNAFQLELLAVWARAFSTGSGKVCHAYVLVTHSALLASHDTQLQGLVFWTPHMKALISSCFRR